MVNVLAFPHFAICVGDLAAATRFYVEGFGFEAGEGGEPPQGVDRMLGLSGARVRTQFVKHPQGIQMELWTIENGEIVGDALALPTNRRGRVNLCFVVDDLEGAAQRAAELGGERLDDTKVDAGFAEIMFCTDPEGTRIELVQMKGDWPGYATQGE